MKRLSLALVAVCLACSAPQQLVETATPRDLAAWQAQAQNVTITRDDWGIPHVRGKTDADAVFGLMYAQAEDDFNRVENNPTLPVFAAMRRSRDERSHRYQSSGGGGTTMCGHSPFRPTRDRLLGATHAGR